MVLISKIHKRKKIVVLKIIFLKNYHNILVIIKSFILLIITISFRWSLMANNKIEYSKALCGKKTKGITQDQFENKMNEVAIESTQGLVQKDLLLD